MTHAQKSSKLVEFGQQILYKKSLPEGLPLISTYSKEIIGADRSSMFIYSPKKAELWTTLADGVERIVVPVDKGIVGKTLELKEIVVENDAYSNPAFLADVDKETGYTTHNIIAAPLFNENNQIVGVFELLNKEGGYTKEDVKYMKFFARSLGNFIELAKLYEG